MRQHQPLMCEEYARMMWSSASSYGGQRLQSVPSLHHTLSTQTILYGLFNFFLMLLPMLLSLEAEERGGDGSKAIASQHLLVRMGKCCKNRIELDYLTDRLNRIYRKPYTVYRLPYIVHSISYTVYRIAQQATV